MQEDDITLLRRFAESHAQDAFAEVVRRNMDAVYSSALRRVGGDVHLAQDVAQQVFCTLACRAGELARHPVLAGWLHAATRNAAANVVRTEIRRRAREQEAYAMNEISTPPQDTASWDRVAPVLDEVIDELSASDRTAVLLRFFDRRSFAEMGMVLKSSEDAARMRVDRAVEKLRVRLARRGVVTLGAALGAALAENTVIAAPTDLAGRASNEGMRVAVAPARPSEWLQVERLACVVSLAMFVTALGVALLAYRASRKTDAELATEQRTLAVVEERSREPAGAAQTTTPVRGAAEQMGLPDDATRRRAGGRKVEIGAVYDPLYRVLQLTPGEIAQFEAIGARSPGATIWTYELASSDPAALPALSPTLSPEASEVELRALLGEAAYLRYQDFNRILPARDLAIQLASAVYLTDPLTAEQGERLTRILAEASPAYRAGRTIDRASLDWEAVLVQAANVLTPRQLAAFGGAVRKNEMFHQALVQRLRMAATAADAGQR